MSDTNSPSHGETTDSAGENSEIVIGVRSLDEASLTVRIDDAKDAPEPSGETEEKEEAERTPLMPEEKEKSPVATGNGSVNGGIQSLGRGSQDTGGGGGDPGGEEPIIYESTLEWKAPDGGWGWVVMVSSLVISLIVDGLCYTFGLFLGPLEREFDAPKSTVALASSLQVGMYLITGPVVSALTNRFGCRPVVIVGSLVAGIAYVVSSWSQNVMVMVLTYGFVGGIGFGLMYLPAIVSVSVYFEEKRALATGIAVCGSGIGMFLLAPLTEFLLETFNWRWTLILLAGLILNGMVFGALIRPLGNGTGGGSSSGSGDDVTSSSKAGKNMANGNGRSSLPQSRSVSESNSFAIDRQISADSRHRTVSSTSAASGKSSIAESPTAGIPLRPLMEGVESITIEVLEEPVPRRSSGKSSEDVHVNHLLLPPGAPGGNNNFSSSPAVHHHLTSTSSLFQRLQLSASHQTLNPEERNLRARTPLGLSMVSLAASSVHVVSEGHRSLSRVNSIDKQSVASKVTSSCLDCFSPSTRAIIQEMLNFSILKNKKFWFVLMGNFFCMIGFYVPFVYIPERAIQLGIGDSQAAFLLSIIGISNTVGRVLIGLIVQCLRLDCGLVTAVALIISGTVTALLPLCKEYAELAALSAVFGLCVAAYVALCSVLLCDLLGVQNLTNAFGYVILFRGVACIIGPPMAGAIIDATGVFHPAFFLGGGMIVLGGLSHLLLYIFYFSPCSKEKRTE